MQYDDLNRFLAESKAGIDYSVLSVAVVTLGLIMVVEVGRHRLDHMAIGKPFFKNVLEGVYAELSTLGMVEFVIWILHSYYENMNIEKEKVFAKVHFTLFYTAILNAFQSVVLAVITRRISTRMWVETETLELNHYVEIREEFDRVQAKLQDLHGITASSLPKEQSISMLYDDFTFDFSIRGIKRFFRNLIIRVQHPGLQTRYNNLLTQIRFHELRVHFLTAYKLPLKLSVSDYLKRSEQHVLIKLVHVNVIAWLLLTVTVNILYFVLGIVATEVENPKIVGDVMTYVFFGGLFLSAVGAIMVYRKMKLIFHKIMISKTLWDTQETEQEKDRLAREQLSLFWGSDPKMVIALIQSMQFGYAVALSVVLIFWDTIAKGEIKTAWYLLPIFGFYALFAVVIGRALPRYTLCTSLARLMNERRLKETVANFNLSEAKLRRLEEVEFEKFMVARGQLGLLKHSDSMASLSTRLSSSDRSSAITQLDRADLMAQLVKLDTNSLRESLPAEEKEILSRSERMARRRNRRKSVSDGVQLMAQLHRDGAFFDKPGTKKTQQPLRAKDDSTLGKKATKKVSTQERRMPGQRRERKKTVSDGVAAMAWNSSRSLTKETIFEHEQSQAKNFDPSIPTRPPMNLAERVKASVSGNNSVASSGLGAIDERHGSTSHHEEDDHFSIASNASDGEHSDIDDVPDIDPYMIENRLVVPHKPVPLSELARSFFLSRRYIVVSNVIGTMWAFYLVGQRIERFLNTEGIIEPGKNVSFDMEQTISFWTLTAWLSFFLFIDCVIVRLFGKYSSLQTLREKKVLLAALMDIALSATCLVLLFFAESQRCCTDDDDLSRVLAEKDAKDTLYYADIPAPCSCPTFGSRKYGGLGKIEPYVSLLALRLFRHYFAKRIVVFMEQASNASVVSIEASSDEPEHPETPFCLTDKKEVHLNKHEHAHMELSGTAVELWEATVATHPEVAAKYGDFSAEILQIMLGIPVVDKPDAAPLASHKKKASSQEVFELEAEYSGLPTAAQEIIMAGKLGKDVRAIDAVDAPDDGEGHVGDHISSIKFIIDEPVAPVPALEHTIIFTAPTARLVRSMRRCDRRLLPFLDAWTVVDVVLTRFEMIYLDASNVDDESQWSASDDGAYQALSATKGGKGLRLCDVTAGRRIVGHLQLSDIVSANIVRKLPAPDRTDIPPDVEVKKNEFWKESPEGVHVPRHDGWLKTKEDRLQIKTVHSRTLELRFYSDLEDNERHPQRVEQENEESGPLFKNNAFQWAQTIGRFCGPEQLKQELPHFGDDTDDELRDYLIVHKQDEQRGHRRVSTLGGFSRSASMLNLRGLSQPSDSAASSDDEQKQHHRNSSLGEVARSAFGRHHSSMGSTEGDEAEMKRPSIFSRFGRKSSANLEELQHDEVLDDIRNEKMDRDEGDIV